MQLYFSPLSYTKAPVGKRPLMNPDPFAGFLFGVQPTRPTSSGHIALRSEDPMAAPEIHPNSLSTEQDRQDMIEGSRGLVPDRQPLQGDDALYWPGDLQHGRDERCGGTNSPVRR